MVTIIFSLSLIFLLSLQDENKNHQNVQAADLTISNLSQLKSFITDVGNGNSYSGKIIELSSDIDMSAYSFLPIGCKSTGTFSGNTTIFKGKFYGNGFTISNFTLQGMEFSDAVDYDVNLKVNGFFGIVGDGAEIKNLCLNNFKVQMPFGSPITNVYVGGLVGQYSGSSSATIKNCQITNMEVIKSSGMADYNKYIGAIIGRKGGTGSIIIQDCYVENFKVSLSSEDWYVDYTIAKVGTAFCTHRGSSTVKNCLVNGATIVTSSSRDTTIYDFADAPSGYVTITSCYTSKQTTYTNYSINAVGGDTGVIWYHSSQYNNGWPKLRVFIDWKDVNFSANPSNGGTLSQSNIKIPRDATGFTVNKQPGVIVILDQTVTATANDGYNIKSSDPWTTNSETSYTANFERKSVNVDFGPPIDENGNEIPGVEIECVEETANVSASANTSASYNIPYDTEISVNIVENKLIYSWITGGKKYSIKYTIPEKYEVVEPKDGSRIIVTNETTLIRPIYRLITFSVTLKSAVGSNITSETTWVVEYGGSIESDIPNLTFTFNGITVTYVAESPYRFDYLSIKKDNTTVTESALTNIDGTIEIQPYFARWYMVTFAPAVDEFGDTDKATITSAQNTIEVKEDDSITATLSDNNKTLTYCYNGTNVEYKANQYYILNNGTNQLTITETCSKTITPEAIFYACKVTMGNIDLNIGTRSVEHDTYGTTAEELKDGIFVVEFGTKVTFEYDQTDGKFTYVYTFSSGQVITYTMLKDEYAIESELIDGDREWKTELEDINQHIFDGPEEGEIPTTSMKSKTISPVFELKHYGGEII